MNHGHYAPKHRNFGLLIGILMFGLILLIAVSLYQYRRANALELAVENQYVHSFHELTDYVKDVDVLLQKSMLISDPRQMSAISSEIYMQTAAAKSNLAQLPVSELNLSDTSKFLSQIGDYTAYLSSKVINEDSITEEEFSNLAKLSEYASSMSGHLQTMEEQLYAQKLSFREASAMTAYAAGGDFASGMEGIEQVFQDYPSLIYDGPFSEHIENSEPVMLKNKPTIRREKAHEIAKQFAGDGRGDVLNYSGEGGGSIPTYDFSGTDNSGRQISLSVTKRGGFILYMLDSREVTEVKLTVEEAIKKAENFLTQKGFNNMIHTYYDMAGNTATINFAAKQEDVVLYSDLIKVKVALDNGEIVGFESKGYLMTHEIRHFPEDIMSEEDVKANLNSHLSLGEIRKALIPLNSTRQVLTYECKGTHLNNNFLIYINAETGQEEKILMLIESENGILTM
ncbi:MAG: germination protein YpeB [Ruminococcaceae bacterium]|nr:germination protein YpeB [Oscillospiraceae bacterium]